MAAAAVTGLSEKDPERERRRTTLRDESSEEAEIASGLRKEQRLDVREAETAALGEAPESDPPFLFRGGRRVGCRPWFL